MAQSNMTLIPAIWPFLEALSPRSPNYVGRLIEIGRMSESVALTLEEYGRFCDAISREGERPVARSSTVDWAAWLHGEYIAVLYNLIGI